MSSRISVANSRTVSSIRKRMPSPPSSASSNDLSTSASSSSHASSPTTASAAARSNEPTNTDSRPNAASSAGSSRSVDQVSVARKVWCRPRARPPPVSSRSRSSRRSRICAGVRLRTRAAASSMASGMPSSRVTMSSTLVRSRRRATKSWRAAPARSTKSRTRLRAQPGSRARRCARRRHPSASRLVATTDTCGHDASTESTRSTTASSRCSQLSRITRTRLLRRNQGSDSRAGPLPAGTPTASASASGTSVPSVMEASWHRYAPSGKRGSTSAATWMASRLLPTPPTPVIVTRRLSRSAAATASTSPSRPTKWCVAPGGWSR